MFRLMKNNDLRKGSTLPLQSRPFVWFGLLAALALCVTGCGKGGGGTIHVKSADIGEKDIAPKSGYAFAVTKSFTDINGNLSTAPSYRVYVANYDLEPGFFVQSLNKPLTSDNQVRVAFSLVGDQGGTEKTAAKAGTYSARADKFMKVEDASLVARKGGLDTTQALVRSTLSGDVKVSSVSGDTIIGEIDLTSGYTLVKGPFTAKILVRK
jgi:hypothetical protein